MVQAEVTPEAEAWRGRDPPFPGRVGEKQHASRSSYLREESRLLTGAVCPRVEPGPARHQPDEGDGDPRPGWEVTEEGHAEPRRHGAPAHERGVPPGEAEIDEDGQSQENAADPAAS